jgi:transcriptional regulator with XRE-family HTH domain
LHQIALNAKLLSMKRIVNKKLIREWIRINGKGALERLALDSGCSASLVQKLCSESYEGIPSIAKIDGICRVTGHDLDTLFPLVCEARKESA